MRQNRSDFGKEGFKEIISRNPKHYPSLLAYAMCCLGEDKIQEAQVFFEAAHSTAPESGLVSTIMVILRLMQDLFTEIVNEESEQKRIPGKTNLNGEEYIKVAEFAIRVNSSVIADKALAHEIILNGHQPINYILLARLETQKQDLEKAYQILKGGLKKHGTDPNIWAEMGIDILIKAIYNSK